MDKDIRAWVSGGEQSGRLDFPPRCPVGQLAPDGPFTPDRQKTRMFRARPDNARVLAPANVRIAGAFTSRCVAVAISPILIQKATVPNPGYEIIVTHWNLTQQDRWAEFPSYRFGHIVDLDWKLRHTDRRNPLFPVGDGPGRIPGRW